MAISDQVKQEVLAFLKMELDGWAASKAWPIPALATDVDLDDDAYLAVHEYKESPAPPHPDRPVRPQADPDRPLMARSDLDVVRVHLQRVTYSATLIRGQLKRFMEQPAPKGTDAPKTARATLTSLVTDARLTQIDDVLDALVGAKRNVEPTIPLTGRQLRNAIETLQEKAGRVVLVMITGHPDDEIEEVIKTHDDIIDYYPFYERVPTGHGLLGGEAAVLVAGVPPLTMRYLAHDLQASVDVKGGNDCLKVTVEERRGWWTSPAAKVVRFRASKS